MLEFSGLVLTCCSDAACTACCCHRLSSEITSFDSGPFFVC